MKQTSRDEQRKRPTENGRGRHDDKPSRSGQAAGGVEGEGSYTGTRQYNEHLAKHLQTHDVEAEAEAAREALEGDEREELEAAEARGKAGPAAKSGSPARREQVAPKPARSEKAKPGAPSRKD